MDFSIDFATILSAGTAVVMSFSAYMLKGVHKDFKDAIEVIGEHKVRIAILEEKVRNLESR